MEMLWKRKLCAMSYAASQRRPSRWQRSVVSKRALRLGVLVASLLAGSGRIDARAAGVA